MVHAGPSAHDVDGFVLIRAYASAAERAERQDAFYGSDAWRQGPREAVLPMGAATLEAWRRDLAGQEV